LKGLAFLGLVGRGENGFGSRRRGHMPWSISKIMGERGGGDRDTAWEKKVYRKKRKKMKKKKANEGRGRKEGGGQKKKNWWADMVKRVFTEGQGEMGYGQWA